MSFLNKLGLGVAPTREVSRPHGMNGSSRSSAPATITAVGAAKMPAKGESTRVSNGLKEFLWNLDGLGRGTLLDLGPAWQTTLSFFIERGFRVSSEDILREWKEFLSEEETRLRESNGELLETLDVTPAARAKRFLESNLRYPASSFDAVLLWDLLDYFEPQLARQVVASLTELLRPAGIIFALFHSKKPEGFQRYRVVDTTNLQVVASPVLVNVQRVYQNREIQDLFSRYRTVKAFIGRDQLRESLFIK